MTSLCINGNTAISGSEDRTVRFWDIKVRNSLSEPAHIVSHELTHTLLMQDGTETMRLGPFEDRVLWLGIMPNASVEESKYLYIGLPSKIIRFDTLSETIIREIRLATSAVESYFRCAAFVAPSQIAVGMTDGNLVLFDVWNGTAVSKSLKGHVGSITDMQSDSQSGAILTVSEDKTLKIWLISDLSAPFRSYSMGGSGSNPYSLAVAGGFVFVGIKQEKVLLYNLSQLISGVSEALERWTHPTAVTSLRVLEGTLVAVSGDSVYLWSISDRKLLGVLEPSGSFINTIEISGTRVFCGGNDNCVNIFRYQTKLVSMVKEAARRKDKDLDLSYCQLDDFPTIVGYAKWIQTLNLAHNSFRKLPAEISHFVHLNTLQLSHNLLEALPDEISLLAPSLTNLQLHDNKLKMVPLSIASLWNLKTLNLSHNQMSFLPPFLRNLPLTALDVSVNPLEDPGPDVIKAGLTAIMDFLAGKASSTLVPVNRVKLMLVGNENVGKTSLVLNLRHKSSLFSARPNIKTLSTQGISIETVSTTSNNSSSSSSNPVSSPSSNARGSNPSSNDQSNNTNPSTPTSGHQPKDSKLTMGIAAQIVGLTPLKDKKKDLKRKVKWYTWDFGGQEVYYHTHQFFITPHSIYLIAFDVTKPLDENNILFWLRCIRARTTTSRGSHSYSSDTQNNKPPVPIILVATHTDSFDRTQLPWLQDYFLENSKEKIALLTKKDESFLEIYYTWIFKKFSAEHPSIRLVTGVSSKTGKGVKELKHAIRDLFDSSSSIRNQVNTVVRERVFLFEQLIQRAKSVAMPPFLTWPEYQTLASGIIDDPAELLEATKLLANLGSLVYLPSSSRKNSWMISMTNLFPEDYAPASTEFVVLDPQWLVDLFATILGTSPNFVRNGMIRSQDLQQIWRDHSKYPPDMHHQLMLILEHFDVAFALGGRKRLATDGNLALPAPKLKDLRDAHCGTPRSSSISSPPMTPKSHSKSLALDSGGSNSSNSLLTSADAEAPTHLFPSLLPVARPQLDILWPKHEHRFQVDRIYTFPKFLPIGLFSRFMVRLLSFFPAYYYWRHGVIISDETKRAYSLIEEIQEENKVVITVRGPVNTVSQFLTSVMDIWTKLVSDMYDISISMTTTCYHCTAAKLKAPTELGPNNTFGLHTSLSAAASQAIAAGKRSSQTPTAHIFDVAVCEQLVMHGERFVVCKNGGVIRLDQLCPDLCLVNIRSLEINAKDLLPWGRDLPDEGVIGEGGFGVVYRKSWKGQKVAVKRLKEIDHKHPGQGAPLSPEEIAKIQTSFRNEIWLMSGVTHPNIVQLLGFSLRHESIMVMEYISGGDLYQALISARTLTWPMRYRIALDIARGMTALHALDPPLCHSDLKCPNCMIVDWNPKAPIVAKVSDFGLSSRLYGDQLTKTPTTNPFWTAPEILAQLPFDTSVDVYSFGVILWNLLSRKAMFEEMMPFTEDVSRAIRGGKRPPIPQEAGLTADYEALIEACWDHRPSSRPTFFDICIKLEEMIQRDCPEIYPIVEKTRAEMITTVNHSQHTRNASIFHSAGSSNSHFEHKHPHRADSGEMATTTPVHRNLADSSAGTYYSASDDSPSDHDASRHEKDKTKDKLKEKHKDKKSGAGSASVADSTTNHDLIRSSQVTNTWNGQSSGSPLTRSKERENDVVHPTYYNNSKLADYGTTMLKQMKLGSVITLMSVVGLSQVWAYSPSMGLMYVINSVSGQFVKSFVAPKDLKCMIEVTSEDGAASELWAAGTSGLHIWHGDTASPIPHTPSSIAISSLLFLHKPDRRAVVWAGLANEPKIQVWSAATHDLLRVLDLQLPSRVLPKLVEPTPIATVTAVDKIKVKTFAPMPPTPPPGSQTQSSGGSTSGSTSPGAAPSPSTTPSNAKSGGPTTVSVTYPSLTPVPLTSSSTLQSRFATSTSPIPTQRAASLETERLPHSVSPTTSSSSGALAGIKDFVGSLVGLGGGDKDKEKEKEKEKDSLHIPLGHVRRASTSPPVDITTSIAPIQAVSVTPRTAAAPEGVHAMIRAPDCAWIAVGPYLMRLNKDTGRPLDGSKTASETEESERSLNDTASVAHAASATSTPHVILAHPGGTHTLIYAGSARVWTCGADGHMKIWDAISGLLLKTIVSYNPMQLLVVDRTQLWATQVTGTNVDAWNLENGELISRIDTAHLAPVNRAMLVFNKTIWTAAQDESIHVFT